MRESWLIREQRREGERERELERKRDVYINSDLYPGGEFVPELDARITVFDRGYTLGDSVYEYACTFLHEPFQIEEHMDRLFCSLKVLRIDPGMDRNRFCGLCRELTERNLESLRPEEEYNIVWEVTRGEWGWHARRPPATEGDGRPTIIIKNNTNPQRLCALAFHTGVHIVTPPSRHITPQSWDPKVKTYSRLNYVLAAQEAALVDPDAVALMLDKDGNLTEATGANVWLVSGGVLTTPSDRNVLKGQTRNNVIRLAGELGIEVQERDLQPWHLYNCDEAFVSSTSPGPLRPISRFNGLPVGAGDFPGPIVQKLAAAWSKWVGIDVTGIELLTTEEKSELEA